MQLHEHLLLPLPLPLVSLRDLPGRLGRLLSLRLLRRHLVEEHLPPTERAPACEHLRLLKLPGLVARKLLRTLRCKLVLHAKALGVGQSECARPVAPFQPREPALEVVAEHRIGFCERPTSPKAGAGNSSGPSRQGDECKRCWHGSPQR